MSGGIHAACDRLSVRSVSGSAEFSGSLAKNGWYDITTHSGSVRLTLAASSGFDWTARTFSGGIRSDLPTAAGNDSGCSGGRRGAGPGRSVHASVGDGSATILVRTFSGGIVVSRPYA